MICRALGARKRDTVNRGPLLIDMGMYNKLGGLDGSFSPFELDDVDICLRAQQKGLGDCYVLPVMYSEINGSKKTSSISAEVSRRAINANKMKILKKHSHYITNKSQKRKYIV
jgi:GT2 family glycosyltransferase